MDLDETDVLMKVLSTVTKIWFLYGNIAAVCG